MSEGQKEEKRMVNGEVLKFKDPEVVADHYRYKGAVENKNALTNYGGTKYQFGLESKRGTTCWPIQVFAFFIAFTEVNTYLAMEYFLKTDDKLMDFRKKLAKALINNSYTSEKTCGCPTNYRKRKLSNILQTAPAHATEYYKKGLHSKI